MSIHSLGQRWEWVKDCWRVIWPMRFGVVVWLAITVLILFVQQAQDALLALVDDAGRGSGPGIGNPAAMAALVFFWAFQTFYWARFVSRLPAPAHAPARYPPPLLTNTEIHRLNVVIPHRLGALVIISVWAALLHANWPEWHSELAISLAALALLLLYFGLVRHRRHLATVIHQRTGLSAFRVDPAFVRDLQALTLDRTVIRPAAWLVLVSLAIFVASGYLDLPYSGTVAFVLALVWIILGYSGVGCVGGLPASTIATLRFNIVVFGLLFLLSLAPSAPIAGGLHILSSAPIIMSVAAAWVFVGTFCLAFPGEALRLPVTTAVVLFAVLVSLIGRSDNHVVRHFDAKPIDGTKVADAFQGWWLKVGAKSPQPVPLVLVATAGGASRAAYWTTKVLTQIEQEHPGFHDHVFAISSVSGGSLGAVAYRAMLNDVRDDDGKAPTPECTGRATRTNIVRCGLDTVGYDFLAPTFLTGLYSDLVQRLLPGSLLPDRARALEQSWEAAWAATMPRAAVKFDQPFHSLWGGDWLPALIINGTSEKSGRRIITSNLQIDEAVFRDAIDFFAQMGREISVSTAIHNSARFPYIDAAGTLLTPTSGMTDRIVDGGYFENFGASSIYDLLECLRAQPNAQSVKFFVLQISSDPELQEPPDRDKTWQEKSPFGLNVSADVTAPLVTFFDTRSALGYRATEVLQHLVQSLAGDGEVRARYAHFRLTKTGEPMSWVLSRNARDELESEWATQVNVKAYSDLGAFMGWQ